MPSQTLQGQFPTGDKRGSLLAFGNRHGQRGRQRETRVHFTPNRESLGQSGPNAQPRLCPDALRLRTAPPLCGRGAAEHVDLPVVPVGSPPRPGQEPGDPLPYFKCSHLEQSKMPRKEINSLMPINNLEDLIFFVAEQMVADNGMDINIFQNFRPTAGRKRCLDAGET